MLIDTEVAGWRVFPVCFRRDDRPDPASEEFLPQEITIIPFVGKKELRLVDRHGQQIRNGIVIRSFATGQDAAKRASLTV